MIIEESSTKNSNVVESKERKVSEEIPEVLLKPEFVQKKKTKSFSCEQIIKELDELHKNIKEKPMEIETTEKCKDSQRKKSRSKDKRDLDIIRALDKGFEDVVVDMKKPRESRGSKKDDKRKPRRSSEFGKVNQKHEFWTLIYILSKYERLTITLRVDSSRQNKEIREIRNIEGIDIPGDIYQMLVNGTGRPESNRRDEIVKGLIEIAKLLRWNVDCIIVKSYRGEGDKIVIQKISKDTHEFNKIDIKNIGKVFAKNLEKYHRKDVYLITPSNILLLDYDISTFELKVIENKKVEEEKKDDSVTEIEVSLTEEDPNIK